MDFWEKIVDGLPTEIAGSMVDIFVISSVVALFLARKERKKIHKFRRVTREALNWRLRKLSSAASHLRSAFANIDKDGPTLVLALGAELVDTLDDLETSLAQRVSLLDETTLAYWVEVCRYVSLTCGLGGGPAMVQLRSSHVNSISDTDLENFIEVFTESRQTTLDALSELARVSMILSLQMQFSDPGRNYYDEEEIRRTTKGLSDGSYEFLNKNLRAT